MEYHGPERRKDERLKDERRTLTLDQAFRQSNDIMFYCDASGAIIEVNDAFVRHYGYSREEALGQTPRLLRSRHSTDEFYRAMWKDLLDPNRGYWRGSIINRAKDGRDVPLALTITTVRGGDGGVVGYISNAVDMTEQIELQGRLAQSEALAAIGEMAAVLAHEIRNPLGSIVVAAKQIATGELSEQDGQIVRRVLQAESRRLNETLNNLLAYARPRELHLERGDLNALVEEMAGIVRSNPDLVGEVKVHAELSPSLKSFPLDASLLRQVLWNIVINGLQAMEGKGTLTLKTGRDGAAAWVKVKDTGHGIPEARRPSLFKPFRTTKQQGTGLGLAIADRIVKAHGGRIDVHSRPGHGAEFVVHLPYRED
jgi:PAS domain S-box-containing protein